jgi:hypothetical protein
MHRARFHVLTRVTDHGEEYVIGVDDRAFVIEEDDANGLCFHHALEARVRCSLCGFGRVQKTFANLVTQDHG